MVTVFVVEVVVVLTSTTVVPNPSSLVSVVCWEVRFPESPPCDRGREYELGIGTGVGTV